MFAREVEGDTWLTHWKLPETFSLSPPDGDYRDHLPVRPEHIAEQYEPVVKDGSWTFGMVQCWGKRSKVARSAVHIPCCPSFRWNPLNWRGICFGRSFMECYWFSVDRTRWSRTTHALRLGREYTEPFQGFGKGDKHEISSLCWFQCCLGLALTLGVGQFFSICGNYGLNCAACYTCHAREKLRRRFDLPSAFGLPPGIDDCLVHFICLYCATHQEMREAIARGLDGPGISPLDVHPESWAHVPGFEEEMAHRKAKLAAVKACGVNFLPMEQRMTRDLNAWKEEHNWEQRPHRWRRASTASQPEAVEMSRDDKAKDAQDDELAGLLKEPASKNLLVRANSVAY
ncbi:hypothetical protein COCOBI_07-2110 [Coccomyxa sp. Obi]|nr:hypothetical protein COCOBI_07-2110 [Coccomyxa sp. Obi]